MVDGKKILVVRERRRGREGGRERGKGRKKNVVSIRLLCLSYLVLHL